MPVVAKMTLTEYLGYDDGTDTAYEFVDGAIVEMPPESRGNSQIALYLLMELAKVFPLARLCYKDTELETSGRIRLPDVMVLRDEHVDAFATERATITRDMPPPLLVVEVVSPGKANQDRDYRYQRSEYASRGILEYWIVDPGQQKITVLTLVDGLYEDAVFQIGDRIQFNALPTLQLTVDQTLNRD